MRLPAVLLCAGFLAGSLAAGSRPGHAQESTPPATITFDVEVTDTRGQPVPGLRQQDFAVRDNRTAAPILSFAAGPAAGSTIRPTQVIFVLDEVNLSFLNVSRARSALGSFLRSYNGPLPAPTALVLLSDDGERFSGDPTLDGKQLAADLEKASAQIRTIQRSAAFYGDLERLDLSLRALSALAAREESQPGRKQVIWMSQGWPYFARPGINYSDKQLNANFGTVVKLSTELRKAGIVLYNVDPLGTDDALGFQTRYYEQVLKAPRKPSETTIGNLGLQVLAVQSGGLVLNSSNDVAGQLARCMHDASAYYTISIAVTPADAKVEYHELHVQLDEPNLTARTRAGYYATP